MGFFGAILYLILCIIVGRAASNRGRSGFGYFFISLLLSPIIGFIIMLALGENKNIRAERIYEEAKIKESVAAKYRYRDSVLKNVTNNSIGFNDTRKCPFCAEIIKREAKICRFCRSEIEEDIIESISEETVPLLSYDDYENPYVVLSDTVLKKFPDVDASEITDIRCNNIVDFLSDAYNDRAINNVWYKVKFKDYEGWCLRTSIKKID